MNSSLGNYARVDRVRCEKAEQTRKSTPESLGFGKLLREEWSSACTLVAEPTPRAAEAGPAAPTKGTSSAAQRRLRRSVSSVELILCPEPRNTSSDLSIASCTSEETSAGERVAIAHSVWCHSCGHISPLTLRKPCWTHASHMSRNRSSTASGGLRIGGRRRIVCSIGSISKPRFAPQLFFYIRSPESVHWNYRKCRLSKCIYS